MKKNRTAKEIEKSWSLNLLGLLFFPLLVTGCSSHDSRFSYFNMLDTGKNTAQNKKAAEKFWSSVRPVSTLSASHYKLGLYYQQQGKQDKAIEEFSKAVRNDSSYCKAYNGIAMSYDALQRCEMASNSYEQAIQCAPQEAYVKNNYACSSILCGDYEKGLALLSEAAHLSEDNSRIKNNIKLAQMLIERENKLANSAPQGATVALLAKAGWKPAENEAENSPPAPPFTRGGTSAPGEMPSADVTDNVPAETTAQNSNVTPLEVNNLNVQTPGMEKAEEMVSLPAADAGVVSKETGRAVKSHLQNNIVTAILAAEKAKKISAEVQRGAALNYADVAIEVSNGNGVTGMAVKSADFFHSYGFSVGRITNAEYFRFNDSVIFYREGYLQVAEELARITPGPQAIKKVYSLGRSFIGVRILLGRDLANIQFPESYARNVEDSRPETTVHINSINTMDTLAATY